MNSFAPREAINNSHAGSIVILALEGICKAIGADNGLINRILEICLASGDTLTAERKLREVLIPAIEPGALDGALDRRAQAIAAELAGTLIPGTVCDIGSGNGRVAMILASRGWDVYCVDVRTYDGTFPKIPIVYHDCQPIPLPSQSFENCLALTTLHHSADPKGLLAECARIARRRLVIIESVFGVDASGTKPSLLRDVDLATGRLYTYFIDWFYNRVLNSNVPTPLTHLSLEEWRTQLPPTGWAIESEEDLGMDHPIVPEHHQLFVLTRQGSAP